jgi:DNA-binding transcriptional MerR regulator
MADNDRELEPAEVAKILGVSTSTVRRYGERGLLQPRRLLGSKHRRYSAESVEDLKRIDSMPDGQAREVAYEALRRRNLSAPESKEDVIVGDEADDALRQLLLSLTPEGLAKLRNVIDQLLAEVKVSRE